MWLWILSILTIVLVWALWFLLQPPAAEQVGPEPPAELIPLWVPILVTILVVLVVAGVLIMRRVRAARAARALEKAIAQQAQEQALNAKPERRAEIQELHRQLQQGIEALKRSKLGGGKRGEDALYVLPWYAIVGPPGAGKTTALRHSGLVFPYLDPEGGGVRGVGGTRNCDWWFTNEAILLDTAGRYATQSEDHDEWMAFLEQLAQMRKNKPLNGVLVAVSISELLDSTEEQIEDVGRKIRSRVDEMQSTLKMTLPVYVLFTKCDLVSGFVEFFGDLKKSDRGQAYGSTFRLDSEKSAPGKMFEGEFDTLVAQLHKRALVRLTTERKLEAREKVYQFPLEFAAIKRNLADFMQAAFAPGNGGMPVPILRGFYFTSGTQEGTPLERVVGAMGRAFGLKPPIAEDAPKPEGKSYFLRDVFLNIVFPDQDVAARSEAELRRLRMQRLIAAAAAMAIAAILMIPAFISWSNNRALVRETEEITQQAAQVDWTGPAGATEKVGKLDRLRSHVELLKQYRDDGEPLAYGWAMYQGDKLFEPALKQYIASLRTGFLLPVKDKLEERLKKARGGETYAQDYYALKAYLLLNDKDHLQDDYEWQVQELDKYWVEALRGSSGGASEEELRAKVDPHVRTYLTLLKSGTITGEPLDMPRIEAVRGMLSRVKGADQYYQRFVVALKDELDDRGQKKYPPVTLGTMFADRQEVFTYVQSRRKNLESKYQEVEGPFTFEGYQTVMASLKDGFKALEREEWVVPLSVEEKRKNAEIQKELDRVKEIYQKEYIRQWEDFFRDLEVKSPKTNKEAISEYRVLSTPDWPYLRLLRALSDATSFKKAENEMVKAANVDGGVVDQIRTRVVQKVESKTRTRVSDLVGDRKGEPPNPITEKFKSMVEFGVPPEPVKKATNPDADEAPPPPPVETSLSKYIKLLEQLSGEMAQIEESPFATDTKKATELFENAVKEARGLLSKMDKTGQELMEPLLMNPLYQAYKALVKAGGGRASGLWEVMVWPHYRDKIKDRYPFNLSATRDASFEDAVAFYKPKDGILWGFYEQYLKDYHRKVNHDYVPAPRMVDSSSPVPTKGFTPFNALLYTCLKRSDEITDALFAGAEKPEVVFNVNLKTVSPIVSEVIFEIDGQRRLYRNEKPFYYEFTWPGQKQTGAKIQVRGAGGLDEEISRDGPWGIFRLFEVAQSITAEKESDEMFTVTWQLTAPPVTVTMEVRPKRNNHPFPLSFFRATNCPPTIGDRFGK